MIDRSEIDAAKERVRIPELWRILNLPGEPPSKDGVKFRSPHATRQSRELLFE